LIFLAFALWATVWSIRSQPVPTLAALATLLVVCAAHVVTTKMDKRVNRTLDEESQ
jgi:hypothetical protein